MAKVCYSKGYRTKAAGRRYASGSTGRSGPRGGQVCTGCAFWQQMTGPCAEYLPRETHSSVRVWGFHGGWFHRHILLAASHDPGIRTPIIKPGVYHQSWYLCTAVQTNCSTMVHCSRYMSQNHQSISNKEHSEVHVPRSWSRVSHGPGVPQSCVG